MNAEIKAKWVAALRSGRYTQGRGRLTTFSVDGEKDCCLGVLCKVMAVPRVRMSWFYQYGPDLDIDCYEPPQVVLSDAEITRAEVETLIRNNDSHEDSFSDIATYIEENL